MTLTDDTLWWQHGLLHSRGVGCFWWRARVGLHSNLTAFLLLKWQPTQSQDSMAEMLVWSQERGHYGFFLLVLKLLNISPGMSHHTVTKMLLLVLMPRGMALLAATCLSYHQYSFPSELLKGFFHQVSSMKNEHELHHGELLWNL